MYVVTTRRIQVSQKRENRSCGFYVFGQCAANSINRLLVIKPFVPVKKNTLPADWEVILKAWVTGVEVKTIGTDNMPVVEDAFTYRLVWALEALHVRRVIGNSTQT